MSAADLLHAPDDVTAVPEHAIRRLIVTWQHPEQRAIQPVGVLSLDGECYEFYYIRNALNVAEFRPLLGFPDLRARYEARRLFPLFAQRAMDPRRPDYQRYVTRLGLSADTTPWEQIARSSGRRQGDTLQLFPEPTRDGDQLTCAFLVHGIRWMGSRPLLLDDREVTVTRDDVERALSRLHPGDELALVCEPTNPANTSAIVTASSDGTPLGYVPDLLVEDLHALRRRSELHVNAEVVNGPDAPWHLRLLARFTAGTAADFEFFTGPSWQPLPEDL